MILITGCAGFIGFHVAKRFLETGQQVLGIDDLNPYYDVQLKFDRLKLLQAYGDFTFQRMDITDEAALDGIFAPGRIAMVIHFAAQAGVRHSFGNPAIYLKSNVVGFFNIMDHVRRIGVPFFYASSSSVYGEMAGTPFREDHRTDSPMSVYAATKKCDEILAQSYWNAYGMASCGLRFFTVYGPYGRPDMAYYSFTRSVAKGEPIRLFNSGKCLRDFTYIDDVVTAIHDLSRRRSQTGCEIFNVGNQTPKPVCELVALIEEYLGRKAQVVLCDSQAGDLAHTHADSSRLFEAINSRPRTGIESGMREFIAWYKSYHVLETE